MSFNTRKHRCKNAQYMCVLLYEWVLALRDSPTSAQPVLQILLSEAYIPGLVL